VIPWNNGAVDWGAVNGTTNVAQLSTGKQDLTGTIYWWRNLLSGESLHDACRDWY